jgi:hypothetical protein
VCRLEVPALRFNRLGGEAEQLDILPMILHALRRQSDANAALGSLIEKYGKTDPYWMAMNYAYRDDRTLALQWAESRV